MFERKYLAGLLAAPLLALPLAALATPTYSLTFLPDMFKANDISDSGKIVGSIGPSDSNFQAATWSGGTLTTYGTLGGPRAQFNAISSNGLITGVSDVVGAPYAHALIYSGAMHDIGGAPEGDAVGLGINASGQVAGYVYNPSTFSSVAPFLYSAGTLKELTSLFPSGGARDINNAGVLVGGAVVFPAGETHAFKYDGSAVTDLGTLGGGNFSIAYGINAGGDIVGEAVDASLAEHAFLYSSGIMHDLGTLGGVAWAYDINDLGEVVGGGQSSAHPDGLGFVYTGGLALDLNGLIPGLSGWNVTEAVAVNNVGQIIGTACTLDFATCRDVLLDPRADPLPEPGTAALLLAGFGGLAWGRTRRRRVPGATKPLA